MSFGMSSVTIMGLNARKYTLKVTPNTSMLQVLEEACKKQGLNPDNYDLKHGNRTLDLSTSVRFSSIPNNALLELQPANKIRKEANVTVVILLESGERLTGDFSPSSLIWDILCHCLKERSESPNHGDDGSTVPVCVYLQQTVEPQSGVIEVIKRTILGNQNQCMCSPIMITGDELKERTLRSLGLTGGKAAFRLLYRQADQLQKQAHVSSPLAKSSTEFASETDERTKSDETSASVISRDQVLDKPEEKAGNSISQQCQWLPSSTPYSDSSSNSSKYRADVVEPEKPISVEHSLETNSSVPRNTYLSGLVSVSSTQENELVSRNLNVAENSSLENRMEVAVVSEGKEGAGIEESGSVTIIGERHAVLFNLDHVSSMPKIDLPDEFYDITIEDVTYLLREYKRTRSETENRPLELQSQKQNENLQNLARYAQTVIRVQFPDRLVLQAVFSVNETVKSVVEFVRGFLENKDLNFYLYTSPPKTNLVPEQTLLESRLLPAALIYFGCGKCLNSYLKPSYRSQLSDPNAASKAAAELRSKNVSSSSSIPLNLHDVCIDENVNVEVNPQQNLDAPSTSNSNSLRRMDHSDSKLPKWLKLSKK